MKEVKLDVENFCCPASEELQNLEAGVPPAGTPSNNYEEWSKSFVANMERLIELVKSGRVSNATFGIDIKAAE